MSDDEPSDHESSDDGSSDLEAAVSAFLDGADAVYEDYDRGYTDADAALHVLESHLSDLREAYDEESA